MFERYERIVSHSADWRVGLEVDVCCHGVQGAAQIGGEGLSADDGKVRAAMGGEMHVTMERRKNEHALLLSGLVDLLKCASYADAVYLLL